MDIVELDRPRNGMNGTAKGDRVGANQQYEWLEQNWFAVPLGDVTRRFAVEAGAVWALDARVASIGD
jgi:hypothetical protein